VSIAAGSAAVTSALIASGLNSQITHLTTALPLFFNLNVIISLVFIGLMTLGNLRGIREAGAIFAVPTYLFHLQLFSNAGSWHHQGFHSRPYTHHNPPLLPVIEPITLWLILRAFSAGAVAMSGTEAISNGVPIFKPNESKNAATTLTVMATLLGVFFVGVSFFQIIWALSPAVRQLCLKWHCPCLVKMHFIISSKS